jgi:carboxyl-terminal processing protease
MRKTMKGMRTTVALMALLILSWTSAVAQDAASPDSATAPKEEFVEPSPALRTMLCKRVWQQISDEYFEVGKLQDWDKVAAKCDREMNSDDELDAVLTDIVVSVGDRWTRYQSRTVIRAHQKMKAEGLMQAGLLTRRHADGKWHIDSLAWGSPASVSVLKEGDIIESVNGKPLTDKMTDVDVWDLFVGNEGSTVKVKAVMDGQVKEVVITLFPTPEDQVSVRVLPDDVLYIRLPTFENPGIVKDFITKLRKVYFERKGALTGVAFDLRNNSGGLFDMALLVSSVFIESGTIVKATVHKGSAETVTEHKVRPMPPFAKRLMTEPHQLDYLNWTHNTPMVVLVNGSSASCSEITAGALQDNKRAYVIGTQSFGKAVGFTMNQLPNGGMLMVTSLKYLTPAGHDIVDKGITPDLIVEQPRGGTQDLALKAAHEYIVKLAAQRYQQVQDGKAIAGKSKNELEKTSHSKVVVALLLAFMGSIIMLSVVVFLRHR